MVEQLDVWCAPAATTHGFTKIEKVFPGAKEALENRCSKPVCYVTVLALTIYFLFLLLYNGRRKIV